MKTYFLLFLILVGPNQGFGGDFYSFRTTTNAWKSSGRPDFMDGKVSTALLDSLDILYKTSPQAYHFYTIEEKIFVYVSCTFDLYVIQDGLLEKQYNYFNRGYNCAANSLVRDGKHHLIGGHGFWTTHMDLLSFDSVHGSWEWVAVRKQPLDYFSPVIYQTSKGIFSLLGGYYNPRNETDALEPAGYFLDWKTKTWQKASLSINGVDNEELIEKGGLYFSESQDFVFFASNSGLRNLGWNLIEKETGIVYYFESRNVDMGLSPYLEISGNQMRYQAPSGELKVLDLEDLKAKSQVVGVVQLLGPVNTPGIFSQLYAYLALGLVFGGCLTAFVVWRRKKAAIPVGSEEEKKYSRNLVEVLLPYADQLLSTEKLDQLFGIEEQANFDSKRMKRSRMINEVNQSYFEQTGRELILREKNLTDKRFVDYKIQP